MNDERNLPFNHTNKVVRVWVNGDAFRLADTLTTVCLFAAPESGKTSGAAKHLGFFSPFWPPSIDPRQNQRVTHTV